MGIAEVVTQIENFPDFKFKLQLHTKKHLNKKIAVNLFLPLVHNKKNIYYAIYGSRL
jgi:hypothetical protein